MNAEPYGLLAEFDSAAALLGAVRRARAEGYGPLEAYAPFPVEGLSEALGERRGIGVPLAVLLGGLAGAVGGYFIQYYSAVIDYPLNVGGRPLHSWQAFLPVTVELTLLGAALGGVLAMLWLNGLPRFHHPLFDAPAFARASRDRFFLCLRAHDPRYEPEPSRRWLETLGPLTVTEVCR